MADEEKKNESSYYDKGSAELATESALTLSKIQERLKLTKTDERLVIALVGLPGRGKSFISRKLQNFLTWRGSECKIFNVGKYRREAAALEGQSADANFFDVNNTAASDLREKVAALAMDDMLKWIDAPFENPENKGHVKDRIGIFDATNSTKKRRNWILETCTSEITRGNKPTGVIFIESICDDPELMRENYITKVTTSPDYEGMDLEEALADIMKRSQKYEDQYETIDDDSTSYIKIYNLSSKMLINHIYGQVAKSIVPALMSFNIGTRPIYICRASHGSDTKHSGRPRATLLKRRESLDDEGELFRDALYSFMKEECLTFARRRHDTVQRNPQKYRNRATVLGRTFGQFHKEISLYGVDVEVDNADETFPCHIATSTVPRACETVQWKNMPSTALSNLNPLDKGEYSKMSMEDIADVDPEWYEKYQSDPFHTRFPGGESYEDMMMRLEPAMVCAEQQVEPVLIVTHFEVLQSLLSYFRNSEVEKCPEIEVPMNTVFKFTPAKGGSWQETQHCIA